MAGGQLRQRRLTVDRSPAPLPAGAAVGKDQLAWLRGVACPAAGNCVAVGWYYVASGPVPLIETLSGGTWVASGHVAGAPIDELLGVACPAQGSCVAAGWYLTAGILGPVVARCPVAPGPR